MNERTKIKKWRVWKKLKLMFFRERSKEKNVEGIIMRNGEEKLD